MIHHPTVKVTTAKMSISIRRTDFEDAVSDGENGDVESASAKIEDENISLFTILFIID